MNANAQVRWLLVLMLACLLFLVARDLVRGDAGRFTVMALRASSPVVFRTDTATGKSSMLELRAGGERWEPIPEPGETPEWPRVAGQGGPAPAPSQSGPEARPLASDEIKALANAILGDELSPDIRMWAIGQLAASPEPRATTALIQLLPAVDEPRMAALIREALSQRDDPRARQALERHPAAPGAS